MEKFSYSKLNVFENCGWRYKLTYVDKHFINEDSIAADFGTLVHYIEESIAKAIQENNDEPLFGIDIESFIDTFININDPTNKLFGVKALKEKYPDKFYEKDKNELTYAKKCEIYANETIYRLQEFLAANRNLKLVGIEQPFELDYQGYRFHGFIDRVFQETTTGKLILEDIKTYSAPIADANLKTPLQFVFYTLAAQEIYQTDNIECCYDLPICAIKQLAGTKGYLTRGIKKIDKLLADISSEDFKPKPSPLCYYCPFSETNPNQKEEAKDLCPYFCKWTKNKKDMSVNAEWMGIENHQAILETFKKKDILKASISVNSFMEIFDNKRRFLLRH